MSNSSVEDHGVKDHIIKLASAISSVSLSATLFVALSVTFFVASGAQCIFDFGLLELDHAAADRTIRVAELEVLADDAVLAGEGNRGLFAVDAAIALGIGLESVDCQASQLGSGAIGGVTVEESEGVGVLGGQVSPFGADLDWGLGHGAIVIDGGVELPEHGLAYGQTGIPAFFVQIDSASGNCAVNLGLLLASGLLATELTVAVSSFALAIAGVHGAQIEHGSEQQGVSKFHL